MTVRSALNVPSEQQIRNHSIIKENNYVGGSVFLLGCQGYYVGFIV